MHEYYKIKNALIPVFEAAGVSEVTEELQPDVFGSAYSEFEGKQGKFRVIWDGKDGCGLVQKQTKSGWEDLPNFVKKSEAGDFDKNLNALVAAVEALLNR